jgi:hypothetical protein
MRRPNGIQARLFLEGKCAMDLRIHEISDETWATATGSVNNVPFYLRIEGRHWNVAVDESDPLAVSLQKKQGFYRCGQFDDADFASGCVSQDVVRRLLQEVAKEYERETGDHTALV